MKNVALALSALLALTAGAAQAETPPETPPETPAATSTLTVTFTVTEAPTGQIMLSLYDNETAHDGGGKPVAQAAVPVENGRAIARFQALAPGSYAIKSFHDVNGDGTMNTNPFGSPIEPFAFSNNAPAQGGPAKWSAASFPVQGAEAAIAITIR